MLSPMDTNEDMQPNEKPEAKQANRELCAAQVAAFLATGGKINQVAAGVSGLKEKRGISRIVYGDVPEWAK